MYVIAQTCTFQADMPETYLTQVRIWDALQVGTVHDYRSETCMNQYLIVNVSCMKHA